jgi:hypothetical protein
MNQFGIQILVGFITLLITRQIDDSMARERVRFAWRQVCEIA